MTQPASIPAASLQTAVTRAGMEVDEQLAAFLEQDALPGTGIAPSTFWSGLAKLAERFTPRNRDLLAERQRLQDAIDRWYARHPGEGAAIPEGYLRDIGYLVEEPEAFTIKTAGIDPEVSTLPGPQLVVPVLNARFLLNAANARWGSLYDALYGTDALDGSNPPAGPLEPARAARVVGWGRDFLDRTVPLADGSWHDWTGDDPVLADATQLAGRANDTLLLRHHGLHIEIVIDTALPVGRTDRAGVADIILEAAVTTIVDFEDSVAAVDAADKCAAYANWLGLMKGDLTASFTKSGRETTRRLAGDRQFQSLDGEVLTLRGRSLLMVRNVGHLMTCPAIRTPDGRPIFEGILDAAVTALIALHDRDQPGHGANSRTGAIYIVKPKMHGPAECAFANDLFDAVEDMLGLARHTIKIGVMDEERRTSANLAACIHAVKDRVFFINTGFLDRTGDEIHTAMKAGPMLRKADIKQTGWIAAYEQRNVQIGLASGFAGRAQIGKGMWPAPDRMHQMLSEKGAHPASGASTAWVPSPTAAVLHAVHYHDHAVSAVQEKRAADPVEGLDRLLQPPVAAHPDWSAKDIQAELDNNMQGILGYVVRWIDQGIGCSKVPDIHDIGLMEDRATLRISSQHIANWLHHGVIDEAAVEQSILRMAHVVDEQNAKEPGYRPLLGREGNCLPIEAARSLVLKGTAQPSGYTEPILHEYRTRAKAIAARDARPSQAA